MRKEVLPKSHRTVAGDGFEHRPHRSAGSATGAHAPALDASASRSAAQASDSAACSSKHPAFLCPSRPPKLAPGSPDRERHRHARADATRFKQQPVRAAPPRLSGRTTGRPPQSGAGQAARPQESCLARGHYRPVRQGPRQGRARHPGRGRRHRRTRWQGAQQGQGRQARRSGDSTRPVSTSRCVTTRLPRKPPSMASTSFAPPSDAHTNSSTRSPRSQKSHHLIRATHCRQSKIFSPEEKNFSLKTF